MEERENITRTTDWEQSVVKNTEAVGGGGGGGTGKRRGGLRGRQMRGGGEEGPGCENRQFSKNCL